MLTKPKILVSPAKKQQGLGLKRFCIHAVFVIKQITKELLKYNKPAYLFDV